MLAGMLMYCDDPCILCVGADMTYAVLKLWNWMAKSGNTMMAIPEKRTLGISAKWIGTKFFPALGLSVVTAQKVPRACSAITEASSSSLSLDQYRSLIGFLEHIRSTLYLRGDKMYGLCEPLSKDLEPNCKVKCSELMHKQFCRMKHRLTVQAGSSVTDFMAFISGQPLQRAQYSLASRRYPAFSDAAKEGTQRPGLGGWICGYVWRVALTSEHLRLHISALEAVAAVVNVCCVHKVIGGTDHLPVDICVECHVDAKATADILIKGRAKSPGLAFLHSQALRIPEFVEMLPFLVAMHCFGLGNIASDAASRGYDDVLAVLSSSLGIRLIWMDPPSLALTLLKACLKHQDSSKHEHCWGYRGDRVGEANHPGPTFQPRTRRVLGQPEQPEAPLQQQEHVKAASFRPAVRASKRSPSSQPSLLMKGPPHMPEPINKRPRLIGKVTVLSLASALWADTSDFRICSGNWEQLTQACEAAMTTAGDAFAMRTAQQDASHWKAWSQYCSVMGTNPLRPPVDPVSDRVGYLREVVLLTNALTHFMRTKKGKLNDRIKLQSAMNILLGANRVLPILHPAQGTHSVPAGPRAKVPTAVRPGLPGTQAKGTLHQRHD